MWVCHKTRRHIKTVKTDSFPTRAFKTKNIAWIVNEYRNQSATATSLLKRNMFISITWTWLADHSQTLSLTLFFFLRSPIMAATRAIGVASNTTAASASCLLFKKPFLSKQSSLCFKNLRPASSLVSKRLFTCRAIFNPEVQIKEEGQPQTLDYRLFFVDSSGKKVLLINFCFCFSHFA